VKATLSRQWCENIGIVIIWILTQEYDICCSLRDLFLVIDTMGNVNCMVKS